MITIRMSVVGAFLSLVCGSAMSGCTVTSTATDVCSVDSALGCTGNAIGYSCSGNAVPSVQLACGSAVTDVNGNLDYCCADSAASSCATDPAVACTGDSIGYSCSGSDVPGSSDSSLSCGAGVVGTDNELHYCCVSLSSSSCVADSTVSGCTGGSYGFSCTSTDTPATSDASLDCSTAVPGSGGASLYCCVSFSSNTCAADASVAGCAGGSYGFSCTSTDTPAVGDPSLNCSTPTTGSNGESLYCCTGS